MDRAQPPHMTRPAFIVSTFVLAACAAPVQTLDAGGDALTVVATIGPQSLSHGALTASAPELAYAFNGVAGDVVAPDMWPAGASALLPTLVLLGPKGTSGHRSAIATGSPRGGEPRHVAIDGFRLPKTGNYLVLVGGASAAATGHFSLRLWMQSSHLPRQETSQVDLTLVPSAVAQRAVDAHGTSPHPWADDEVDAVIADMLQQADARVALSSAQSLLSALSSQESTDAQRNRAVAGASRLVGTAQDFAVLDGGVQAFALWWLGSGDGLLFKPAQGPLAVPQNLDATVRQLVAAWPGAQEDAAQRRTQARTLGGVVYGWQVEWSATQADLDGAPVWNDFSREWFDAAGNWLGEQSQGATEPDDD